MILDMKESQVLSSLAMVDARHDFDEVATQFYSLLQESLPGPVEFLHDEDDALEFASRISGRSLVEIPYNDKTPENNDFDAIFTELGGSSSQLIAILCDASMCADFVRRLTKNSKGRVYYVQNREQENDGGTNITDKRKLETLNVMTELNKRDERVYSAYISNNDIMAKFGSVYNISLYKDKLIVNRDGITSTYPFVKNNITCIENNLKKRSIYSKNAIKNSENLYDESIIRYIHDCFYS